MVPLNKTGSWGIIDNLVLNTFKFIFAISIPSILIFPAEISINRNKAMIKELFPAPVRPTIPKIHYIIKKNHDIILYKSYQLIITYMFTRFNNKWNII